MSTPEEPTPRRRRIRKRVTPQAPGTTNAPGTPAPPSDHGAFTQGTPAENLPDLNATHLAEDDHFSTFKKSTEDEDLKPTEAELERRNREKKKATRKKPAPAPIPDWDQSEEELAAQEAARIAEAEAKGLEKKEKSRKKRKEEPSIFEIIFAKMSKAFLLFAGLIVISLTALGTWGIIHISKKIKQNTTAQKPVNQLNTQPRQTTGMENFVPSTEITDTAYQLIISYLTAGTLEEKSQFVRNSDRVRPLMTNWYSRVENFGKEKAINVKQFGHVRMLRNETNHLLFVEAAVDEDFRRKFFALVSPIEKVDYKIDWEVTEGYQPIPLDEFKKIRPIEPVTMRLHLTNGNYYNYAFNDETRYRCYELTFPGTDFQIYGYVERDSDIDEQIIATAKTANTQNFMLDVAFPPSLLSNDQVEIRALVHENWFP